MKTKRYEGINKDPYGAMNPTGNVIRDAWVFGIIPETEFCEGWDPRGIDSLYDKVAAAWEPYGHLISNLPEDLQKRHRRIYDEAIAVAREKGWNPELGQNE